MAWKIVEIERLIKGTKPNKYYQKIGFLREKRRHQEIRKAKEVQNNLFIINRKSKTKPF